MSATDTYSNLVQQFYVAYFGRPADPAAVPSFAAALASANAPTTLAALTSAYSTNTTIRALVDSFGNSHESAALYGTVTSDVGQAINFVTAIFTNLFNRAPVQAGVDFWVNALLNGSLSPGNAALTIAAAAAANTTGQGVLDAQSVANKTAVAIQFTADLNNPNYVAAYAGADAAAQARALLAGVNSDTDTGAYAAAAQQTADTIANVQPTGPTGPTGPVTFTLTSGNDTQTAAVFNGTLSSLVSTLNAGDALTGTGTAVLNLTSDGTTLPTGATLSHIQTINITATNDQIAANVSGYTDVTALNITVGSGAAGHASTVTAAATQAVSITGDVLSGTGHDLTVNGGSSVTITAVGTSAAGSAALGVVEVLGAAGAVNVTETYTAGVASSNFAGVYVNGAAAVTLNSTVNTGAFDNTGGGLAGTLQVENATGAVTITDTTNVSSTAAFTNNAQNVFVQGAGTTVTVNETVTTVSGTTGVSTVQEGSVYIMGGATTTTVTVNQAAPVVGSVGGAAHVVDGGVYISDLHGGSTTLANTLTTVTLSNYDSATLAGSALATVTLSGTNGALSIHNAAAIPTATTLTLNLNATASGVITDTNNEIDTFAIHTTGNSSLAGLTDNGLTTLNLSGTGNLAIGTVDNSGTTAETIVLSNTGTGLTSIANWSINGSITELDVSAGIALGGATNSDPAVTLASGNGVTVDAHLDNARLNLALDGANVGNVDVVAVGNGNNHIVDTSNDGTVDITVGTGANVIDLSNSASATYSANVVLGVHTAAAGGDTVIVGALGTSGATVPAVVVHGVVSGDHIAFTDTATSATVLSMAEQATISAAGSLDAAIAAVDALATTTADSATMFQYGGDTYVLESVAAGNGTLTSADGLVELAGVTSSAGISIGGYLPLYDGASTFTGSSADDHFYATFSDTGVGAGNTFLSTDTIHGVSGNDTLTINPFDTASATTLVDSDFGSANISHVQILVLGSTSGANDLSLTTGSNFASDFATVNLTAKTDAGALTLDLGAYNTVAGIIAISTSGAVNVTTGTGADIVGAASSGDVTITSHSTTGATLTGTTATGNLEIDAAGAATSGTYHITATGNNDASITIDASHGVGAEVYNITLGTHSGAGAEISVSAIGTGAQATAGTYAANTVITGAIAGDQLLFTQTVSAGNNLGDLTGTYGSINAAIAGVHSSSVSGEVECFSFGGNTYLLQDVVGGVAGHDSTVIELTGIHTIGPGVVLN